MATTTKSKASRSTKKPAKTSRATAAKSTKKSSVKSTPIKAASAAKATVKGPLSPLERIRSLHVSKALVYLIFTGLVIGFGVTSAAAVKLGIMARDQFASGSGVALAPANEVIYNVEPKYALAAALLVSAIFSILLATKLRSRYEATLANSTSGYRWLAFGLSGALLLTFINLLVGVDDFSLIKLSGFLILVTTMLSFIAERENTGPERPKLLAFNLALLTGAMAWLPVIVSLIGTSLYGLERFGWHVYALVAVTLIGFTSLAFNQYRHLRSSRQADYLRVEENYLRIDMLTKFAVVIIVMLALK